jgi:hypothetical protein
VWLKDDQRNQVAHGEINECSHPHYCALAATAVMVAKPVGHARLVERVASTLNVSGANETKGAKASS